MKIIAVITLGFLSSVAWNGAYADTDEVPTTTVNYGDLNLGNREGMATLYQRIERASRTVCAAFDAFESSKLAPLYKACLTKAMSEAVVNIGKPQFTDYSMNRSGPVTLKLAAR